jgi:hypothetical protein
MKQHHYSDDRIAVCMGGYRPATRRNYNFAWGVWSDYLKEKSITVDTYNTAESAEAGFVQFLQWMAMEKKTTTNLFFLLRSALSSLFHFLFNVDFGTLFQAKLIAKRMRNEYPRQGKHRTVFDISLLLQHYRALGDNSRLDHLQLCAKVGTMLILYPMLRPEDMLRLDMTQLRRTEKGLQFHAVLKNRPEYSECVIAQVQDEAICPVRAVLELWRRVCKHAPSPKGLFYDVNFVAPLNKYHLERGMRDLMTSAGVPSNFTPYSIKHASITFLLKQGVDEQVINRNARLSRFAGTAVRYYFVGEACTMISSTIAAAPPPSEIVVLPAASPEVIVQTLHMDNIEVTEIEASDNEASHTDESVWPFDIQWGIDQQSFLWNEDHCEGIQWSPSVYYDDAADGPFSSFLSVCNLFSPSRRDRAIRTLSPSGLEGSCAEGGELFDEDVCAPHTGSMPLAPRQAADDPNSSSLV